VIWIGWEYCNPTVADYSKMFSHQSILSRCHRERIGFLSIRRPCNDKQMGRRIEVFE
jgi:hypothetical protein